jgi:hypothetical protein
MNRYFKIRQRLYNKLPQPVISNLFVEQLVNVKHPAFPRKLTSHGLQLSIDALLQARVDLGPQLKKALLRCLGQQVDVAAESYKLHSLPDPAFQCFEF